MCSKSSGLTSFPSSVSILGIAVYISDENTPYMLVLTFSDKANKHVRRDRSIRCLLFFSPYSYTSPILSLDFDVSEDNGEETPSK